MAFIGPRHGFASCLSGRLILSRETDWSRIGLIAVEAPFGGIVTAQTISRGRDALLRSEEVAMRCRLRLEVDAADRKMVTSLLPRISSRITFPIGKGSVRSAAAKVMALRSYISAGCQRTLSPASFH